MDFEQHLNATASVVETRLEAIVARLGPTVPARLISAMGHGLLGGGKRLRPLLVLESARVFGADEKAALEVACALECVHCYSLVHDDLPAMDNDDLRRGKPTVWKAYDDWTAVLAGDGLLTLAFEILASPGTGLKPEAVVELVAALSRASGGEGMVGGQCLDLESDKLRRSLGSEAAIRHLQALKTGALIKFAALAGPIVAGAGAAERHSLSSYGENVGLAFQIADDLLDVEGDASIVGKATAKDAAAGKATLVSMLGVAGAKAELARVEEAAVSSLKPFGARAQALVDIARFVSRRSY